MALFGRTEPMAVATRALEDAVAGRGGVLVVTGEAGIGKSALARALATQAEARGARVCFGRAWEVGGAPAFWPWSQALAELDFDLDELLGSVAGAMPSAQRPVAFDRVVRAVCTASGPPLVLILDDLHAADVASLELALAFSRALARKRALLIVTTRESELLERREIGDLVGKLVREGALVPLRRLDAAATESWLSSVGFQGDASEVHRLSEGNPLFIEEAVRLGVDRFATAAVGGVAVVLAEHLARISSQTREILAVASVFGREASHADVAALGGNTIDETEAAAREGQLAGVLSSARGGTITFAHVLLRDSLYESLVPSRRAKLHASVADRIDAQGGPLALVAQHLLAAGDAVDPDRIARTICRAAEAEVARHAADSAIAMIASARTRLVGRMNERTALALDLAEVEAIMRSAPSDEARSRCAAAAACAKRQGLATEQARAAIAYGREVLTGRIDPVMVSLLEDALASTPADERALRAQVLSRLAAALAPPPTAEGLARVTAYAREATAIARELGDVPTLINTLLWSTHGLIFCVPLEERVELTGELVSLAREHGADLVVVSIGGFHTMSLLESGRPVAARREAETYARLVESLPIPTAQWRLTTLRGTWAALDGHLDEAVSCLDELRRTAATNQQAGGAWALFELGFALCFRQLDRLREVERDMSAFMKSRTVLMPFLTCMHALLGRREEVQKDYEELLSRSFGLPPILCLAQAAVLIESRELAELSYPRLLEAAPFGRFFFGPSGAFPIGPVSLVLGELAVLRGDRERAREHMDAAVSECREMDAAPFVALCEAARGRLGDSKAAVRSIEKRSPEVRVTLVREGDVWVVTSSTGPQLRVKHSKGLDYLDHLLSNPGREVYALALAGAGEGPEDAGSILDDKAKQAYRRRVEELEDRLSEAEQMGDRGRVSRAREELEVLAEQLASAVGLGGRDRKAASNVERARVNVQRRLKDVIRRIAEHDATLGRYLEATVRTGTYCVYTPV